VVQVTTSTGTGANVPVQFAGTGSISLSATTATTDANGRASITVTAGTVTGPASVTASVAGSSGIGTQTFQLTVVPPAPLITAGNFVNGADQQLNSLSPCSVGAIVAGAAALPIPNTTPSFPGLPIANNNVKLTIGNISAPILSVGTLANGQQQIAFQVPCEVTPASSVPAALNLGGGTTSINLQIQAASPGVYQQINSDGVARAVVLRPDGSFATPSNPARRGETVVAYVTGLGATVPSVGTSSLPVPGSVANVQGTVVVGMAGQGVQVNSAKLSQDMVGVYTVTFQIPGPNDIGTGDNLSFSVALIPQGSSTAIYSATTKIPVQ